MVSNLEELGSLLDTNNITPADLEFIVKFMQNENISPQLAMRRIKAFDTLKSKLESNDEKEKIAMLEEELNQIKNQLVEKNELLQELQVEKSGLENQKQELETKSELIDSERDELQRQLEMIKEMQFDNEPEVQPVEADEKIVEFINSLSNLEKEAPADLVKLLKPIKETIQKIVEDEDDISFDGNMLITTFNNIISNQRKETEISNKVVDEPEASIEKHTSPQEVVKEEVKKVQEVKKPTKKVTEKEEQILNLFLEFIKEADSDASFKERVSTICDMDEAYQYLGSIGLSQMYSFSSRGIDKKEELIQLLNSWKKEGIPR